RLALQAVVAAVRLLAVIRLVFHLGFEPRRVLPRLVQRLLRHLRNAPCPSLSDPDTEARKRAFRPPATSRSASRAPAKCATINDSHVGTGNEQGSLLFVSLRRRLRAAIRHVYVRWWCSAGHSGRRNPGFHRGSATRRCRPRRQFIIRKPP